MIYVLSLLSSIIQAQATELARIDALLEEMEDEYDEMEAELDELL